MLQLKPFVPLEDHSQQLLPLLLAAVESECLSSHLYYHLLNELTVLTPTLVKGLQASLVETNTHHEDMLKVIKRLGGKPRTKTAATRFSVMKLEPYQLINMLYESDAFLAATYTDICTLTMEYDYQIFDLSYRNLSEKVQHLDQIKPILQIHAKQANKKRETYHDN
ncbi:hypothetical protein OA92_11605 [Marinomonas sp. SBI22]|uniref:hypothetical protein n=1 Tax=unclassified Marinomonas TaxID=196814 RepID=UPI0007AF3B2A|nr:MULTISPECIES: hypothetical protein [unclassified Marinomonas]KZM42546.1 hypothetical protein OA92_11605 [Marinomonas sp. SBI22]KZM43940.1 hypothetical protein OA91_11030 [Marinomonas sp. SBI8L]